MDLPPVGYYFMVNFIYFPVPNLLPVDMRFQSVSGFNISMQPYTLDEGGQNLFTHRLPSRYTYQNLVLKRGLSVLSLVNATFQEAMSLFRFTTATVLVTLLNENDIPVNAWMFFDAYPVAWSSDDLDATQNKVVIETLELAYTRFQRLTL